jgi:hypothetical protein
MRAEAIMASTKRFPDATWKDIVSVIASSFNMNDEKKAKLLAAPTPKLIAAIPYLAGCREPKRTALAHLATYLVAASEAGEATFDHNEGDNYDVLARLATIGSFEGGNPAIINKGMKMLALIMIRGYKKDLKSDKAKGLYNPVLEGRWDVKTKLASLESAIASTTNDEMDTIVSGMVTYWGWHD